jgi:hypothetical protein
MSLLPSWRSYGSAACGSAIITCAHTGYPNPYGVHKRASVPPNGGSPGSGLHFTAPDYLDRYQVDYAALLVLTYGVPARVQRTR